MEPKEFLEILSHVQFRQSLDLASYFGIVLASGLSAFLVYYLKEKGRNYANKEDFEELKRQLAENTKIAEVIKQDLSNKGWISQQVWLRKQDAYEGVFALLFNVKKYVSHQVDEFQEWEHINYYHPCIQDSQYGNSEQLFKQWKEEKLEYEEKLKSPKTKAEAESLKTRYENSVAKLFELIEVKSIYLEPEVASVIRELKKELSITHDYEEWDTHFRRISKKISESIAAIQLVCKRELGIET